MDFSLSSVLPLHFMHKYIFYQINFERCTLWQSFRYCKQNGMNTEYCTIGEKCTLIADPNLTVSSSTNKKFLQKRLFCRIWIRYTYRRTSWILMLASWLCFGNWIRIQWMVSVFRAPSYCFNIPLPVESSCVFCMDYSVLYNTCTGNTQYTIQL